MWWSIAKALAVALGLGTVLGGAVAGVPGAVVGLGIGLVLGATLLSFLGMVGAFGERFPFRPLSRRFRCQYSRRDVDAVFLQNADSGKAFDVESCTLFKDPRAVTCAKRCLDDVNADSLPAAGRV